MSRNEYYKESIWKFIKEKESKHSNPTQIKHLGSPLTTNNKLNKVTMGKRILLPEECASNGITTERWMCFEWNPLIA